VRQQSLGRAEPSPGNRQFRPAAVDGREQATVFHGLAQPRGFVERFPGPGQVPAPVVRPPQIRERLPEQMAAVLRLTLRLDYCAEHERGVLEVGPLQGQLAQLHPGGQQQVMEAVLLAEGDGPVELLGCFSPTTHRLQGPANVVRADSLAICVPGLGACLQTLTVTRKGLFGLAPQAVRAGELVQSGPLSLPKPGLAAKLQAFLEALQRALVNPAFLEDHADKVEPAHADSPVASDVRSFEHQLCVSCATFEVASPAQQFAEHGRRSRPILPLPDLLGFGHDLLQQRRGCSRVTEPELVGKLQRGLDALGRRCSRCYLRARGLQLVGYVG